MKKAIVIGAGPSLQKYNHLEMLANSNYDGYLVITDFILKECLKKGISPQKFPNYFALSCEETRDIAEFYNDEIISNCGNKITAILFDPHPDIIEQCKKNNMNIILLHNKDDDTILSNAGAIAWFTAYSYLGIDEIVLIGLNQSLDKPHNWTVEGYNKDLCCKYYLDFLYVYYYDALRFILKKYPKMKAINCSQEGSLEGESIINMRLQDYLVGIPRNDSKEIEKY